jgi:hypothetical protein
MIYRNGGQAWAYTIAKFFAYGAMVLGGIAALLGIMVMGQGQMFQGLIYTVAGAFIAYTGWKLAEGLKEEHDMQEHLKNDPNAQGAKDALRKDAIANRLHWDDEKHGYFNDKGEPYHIDGDHFSPSAPTAPQNPNSPSSPPTGPKS